MLCAATLRCVSSSVIRSTGTLIVAGGKPTKEPTAATDAVEAFIPPALAAEAEGGAGARAHIAEHGPWAGGRWESLPPMKRARLGAMAVAMARQQ